MDARMEQFLAAYIKEVREIKDILKSIDTEIGAVGYLLTKPESITPELNNK